MKHSEEPFDRYTDRARKVLTLAQEEAQRFNHNYIGTEHLLLGLVREGEGVAAKVLFNLGVELTKVRSGVEFIIGRGERQVVGEIGLTPRAKKVLDLSRDEAAQLGHHYIGTEHLLLGLIREGEGIAAGVLESLGVKLERVRSEVIKVLTQTGSGRVTAERPITVPVSTGQRTWAYLLLHVVRRDGRPVIERVMSSGWEGIEIEKGVDLHEVLARLGTNGWELTGIDPAYPAESGEPAGPSIYVFKYER